MPEIRIAEILSAVEVDADGGEKRLIIEARVTGDTVRLLEELKAHSLSIFLTEADPICGVIGRPQEETLTCQLKKGHRGAYHKSGHRRWIGYHPEREGVQE